MKHAYIGIDAHKDNNLIAIAKAGREKRQKAGAGAGGCVG